MSTRPFELVRCHAASSVTVMTLCVAIILLCLGAWSVFPYSDTAWAYSLLSCFATSGTFGIIATFQGKR
jgi:hypothetical protein